MNVVKIRKDLESRYPGVVIKENYGPAGKVCEIVGEIDRKQINSKRAVALAVIDRSPEHYHRHTTEEYEVIKGKLTVFLNGEPKIIKAGDKLTVEPGVRHRAEGEGTWIYCYSEPDWTPEDYHLI